VHDVYVWLFLFTDNERSSSARHAYTASCRRQFDHIIGDVLFSAPSATVVRNEEVQLVVRLGNVVRGVLTTLEFGDGFERVDNVTLSTDRNNERDDLSANYRYRAVVSHRYSCAGRYRVQLTVLSTYITFCTRN